MAESTDEKYIHARGLLKNCDYLIRNQLKNDTMLFGGPTDFMQQIDDLNQMADSFIQQFRSLAWHLEYRINAKIKELEAQPPVTGEKGSEDKP